MTKNEWPIIQLDDGDPLKTILEEARKLLADQNAVNMASNGCGNTASFFIWRLEQIMSRFG